MSRRRFSLEEGLRQVINKENIAIPSDTNIVSLSNIEDIDDGSDASISELIATLSFRLADEVQDQSWTPV